MEINHLCGTLEIDFHTAPDRELRDAPVVVRVPVVVAEMFVVVGPTKGRVGPGRPTALERNREGQDLRHDDVEGDGHGAARRREQDRPNDRARAPRSTTRRPYSIYSASKKPNHCCVKRFPWRGASSVSVMISLSG